MAHDFLASRAKATALIAKVGQVGSIRRSGTDYPATFAQILGKQEDIAGENIQVNTETVLLSATGLAITPKNFDILVFANGAERRIDSAVPFSPSGVPVYYELKLEGA